MKNGENPTHFVKTLRKSPSAIFSAQENHLSGLGVFRELETNPPEQFLKIQP